MAVQEVEEEGGKWEFYKDGKQFEDEDVLKYSMLMFGLGQQRGLVIAVDLLGI